ncbi:unnamed protein product [Parascedosporium putredinis]|uniref:ML-like domain-containing protein n=1 Tax=Parascedosporium putredinis TaxID=1442378 RepID=A0A9P1M9W3_9PEZI|nr:unnamed protein product [Parascedosporium putredinis]CAI7992860.1 unnamed protein product [Parascedosporium putredinis]
MKGLFRAACAAAALASGALAVDILETVSFSSCANSTSTVQVQRINIQYNKENQTVTFDVQGSSSRIQNVTAELKVTAFGAEVYSNKFNPCDKGTFVEQLCPVPAGTFGARGTQLIPKEFADLVPAIAFQVPDIAALATLELKSLETGEDVGCVQSQVSNGKTASVPAVSYVAAGVAGAALVVGGVSAISAAISGGASAMGGGLAGGGSATGGGMGTVSPSFTEVFGWFQGMAMNGMLSVNYPPIYRSFAKNFAFSTGLIPWTQMQEAIDGFRGMTGGNLTQSSVAILRNTTLVFPDGSTASGNSSIFKVKRAFEGFAVLAARQIETSIDTTTPVPEQQAGDDDAMTVMKQAVSGIQAYVQQLSIPESNTFMTVLLVVAIVIVTIAVGILLIKHYWGSIARAITSLIFLLYGIWVLYCVVQFTKGDSWAAKSLAGVTLFLFTAILLFFSYKIWSTARKLKRNEGDTSGLYENKDIWVKYSLFYESYRKDYWWIFVPTIGYMFVKGTLLAVTDGNGKIQTGGQIIVEAVMLVLLLWSRPYERKSGNIINIVIQVVRVLSVVCILVFVEELGIAQTTQTITGVVLIAVQSALTGILAILILWNAINQCCKKNPHRERRKELEKVRDTDNLTPLDARNSLLLDRSQMDEKDSTTFSMAYLGNYDTSYSEKPSQLSPSNGFASPYRPITPNTPISFGDQSREGLINNAAPIGYLDSRQPTIPNLGGFGGGYGGQQQQQQQQRGYGNNQGYGRSYY